MDWLADEAKGSRQITGYILLAALVDVALVYTVRAALINWGIVPDDPLDPDPQSPFKYYNALMFFGALVQAPLLEETIFRLVPLTIVIFFTKRPTVVLTTVVLLAALFGAIHPTDTIGRVQAAAAGLAFGVVFLKTGGLQGKAIKPWLCSMVAHSAANLFLFVYIYYDYLEQVL